MARNDDASTKTCPNCGAQLAEEHVLCVTCGYHFGLGRCLDDTSAPGATRAHEAKPPASSCPVCRTVLPPGVVLCPACDGGSEQDNGLAEAPPLTRSGGRVLDGVAAFTEGLFEFLNAKDGLYQLAGLVDRLIDGLRRCRRLPPAEQSMSARGRNLARACVLYPACAALLYGLFSFFSETDTYRPPVAQHRNDANPREQATQETGAQGQEAKKPKAQKLALRSAQRTELAADLQAASEQEIMAELDKLNPTTRHQVAALYIRAKLKGNGLTRENAAAFRALGKRIDEKAYRDSVTDFFRSHRDANEMGDWWAAVAQDIPDPGERIFVCRGFVRTLSRPVPLPEFLPKQSFLGAYKDEKTGDWMTGVAPATEDLLRHMRSSLVLLRAANRLYSGIVISQGKGVAVVTQLIGRTLENQRWEAALEEDGEVRWVPTSSQSGMLAGRYLLRFPAEGALATRSAATLAVSEEGAEYIICPVGNFDDARNAQIPIMPTEWGVGLAPESHERPRTAHPQIRGGVFLANGEFVGFSNRQRPRDPIRSELAAPQALPNATRFDPEDPSVMTLDYFLFDLTKQVTGTRALVMPPGTDQELTQLGMRYALAPGTLVLEGAREIPATSEAPHCSVRITDCPSDGLPFVVQLRLDLEGDKTTYSQPFVIAPARNVPAKADMWLGGGQSGQAGTPLADAGPIHTVNADTRHYGDLEITDLALEPKALIPDADCTHFYVADAVGIRRISLDRFREVAAFRCPCEDSLMAGSTGGLAAMLTPATIGLLDPGDLVLLRQSVLGFEPSFLAGTWTSPFLFAADRQTLCVIDAATGNSCQTFRPAALLLPEAGRDESFRGLALSPDASFLFVVGRYTIRRVPIVPGTGLGTPEANPAIRQAEPVSPGEADRRLAEFRKQAERDMQQGTMPVLPVQTAPGTRADGQYAFVGPHVYDLTTSPPQPVLTVPAQILAMSPTTGQFLAYAQSEEGKFRLFDRRGAMAAVWGPHLEKTISAHELRLDRQKRSALLADTRRAGGFVHPDGRHYLAWDSFGAVWVAVDSERELRRSTRQGGGQSQ
jgi:hypothetical protein